MFVKRVTVNLRGKVQQIHIAKRSDGSYTIHCGGDFQNITNQLTQPEFDKLVRKFETGSTKRTK